ncbi:TPA: hypothetical protein ACH3X2_005657 [Trebouxia sp. C0005]
MNFAVNSRRSHLIHRLPALYVLGGPAIPTYDFCALTAPTKLLCSSCLPQRLLLAQSELRTSHLRKLKTLLRTQGSKPGAPDVAAIYDTPAARTVPRCRSRRYSSSDIGSRATSDSDSSDSDNGLYHRHTKVQHRHRKVQ